MQLGELVYSPSLNAKGVNLKNINDIIDLNENYYFILFRLPRMELFILFSISDRVSTSPPSK